MIEKDDATKTDLWGISADASLTRKEFIKKVVTGAAVTGGALAAPAVLDKFLVPRAYAATSINAPGCGKGNAGQATQATGKPDVVASQGKNIYCDTGNPLSTTGAQKNPDTTCVNGGDATLVC